MPTLSLVTFLICSIPLAVMDIRERRLPNGLNALLAIGGVAGHAYRSISDQTWQPLLSSILGGLVGLGFMLMLWGVSRGGLGMGDVKLVGALGCSIADAMALFVAVALAFVIAALWALVNLVRRRCTRRSRLAFGPFILLGAWLVVALP